MNATVEELRAALERLRQAAEEYLDTEHRSDPRDAELRRKLSEAALHASFVLHPPSAAEIVALVVRAAGNTELRSLVASVPTHAFEAGGDDSAFGSKGAWCSVWVVQDGKEDQCGLPPERHSVNNPSVCER